MTKLLNELYDKRDAEKASFLKRFFKTSEGQYGYGDKMLGITVPIQRMIAKKYYKNINLDEVEELLHNEYHEVRLTSLFILGYKMKKSSIEEQKSIIKLYLDNTKYINNWDLVDSSAYTILGYYLYENNINRKILYDLVKNPNLWEQRIAIIATKYFIEHHEFEDTIKISEMLLNHNHDLIHKAVGWMLREVGKKDYDTLYNFLLKHSKVMPRTMLRYAIEKFDKETKTMFMNKTN